MSVGVEEQGPRALVVSHVSAIDAAVAAATRAWGRPLHVLAYGRSSEDVPMENGTLRLHAPPLELGLRSLFRALRWIAQLRRRRYEVVAIGQPSLGLSRARGLLVAFPLVAGGRHRVILDPSAGEIRREITVPLALAELARWAVLQVGAGALVAVATPILDRLSRAGRRPARQPAGAGRAVYLRTDLDLAVTPLIAGGSVAHTEGILAAMRRRGYDVELLTTGDFAGVPDGVSRRNLPVLLRGNVPTELAELISGLVQAASILRQHHEAPTLIYQRYSLNNLAGLLLSRRWGVPLILEANGSEHKWRSDWSAVRYPGLAAATERLLLRRADRVSAVSRNAMADLLDAGAPPHRVRVVPNAVDVVRFAKARPARLPFPSGSFVIAFVGLFYPWHGVRYLADAFVRFRRDVPEARLVLVGDGEEAAHTRRVLAAGGALGSAQLTGLVPRSEVPGYLAAADVVVSPHAAVENFIGSPIKLFEYLASGRAIVASRVAQMGELLDHEGTALLVPPEDPDALAAALRRLHGDTDLRARLGAAAREEARRLHSWDARLDAILAP